MLYILYGTDFNTLQSHRELKLWLKKQVKPYGIEVANLSSSWSSGLALCALIHRYRPDLMYGHLILQAAAVRPAVRVQYNHCRSRKSIRGHFNLFPVYNPFLLQVLSQLYCTSTTPNKDQQKEPGHVHEFRGNRLAACVFYASRKTASRKRWHDLFHQNRFLRFRYRSVELGQLYNMC